MNPTADIISFTSHNGCQFAAARNLKGVITVTIPRGWPEGLSSGFCSDLAEFIGWHSFEIYPNLTQGFAGYDTLRFEFKESD